MVTCLVYLTLQTNTLQPTLRRGCASLYSNVLFGVGLRYCDPHAANHEPDQRCGKGQSLAMLTQINIHSHLYTTTVRLQPRPFPPPLLSPTLVIIVYISI